MGATNLKTKEIFNHYEDEDAFIIDNFKTVSGRRFIVYRNMSQITKREIAASQWFEVISETKDYVRVRFLPIPSPVNNILPKTAKFKKTRRLSCIKIMELLEEWRKSRAIRTEME